MTEDIVRISSFYEFTRLDDLGQLRASLLSLMEEFSIVGSFIIASEGFNAMVAGSTGEMQRFLREVARLFGNELQTRDSYDTVAPFKRRKVKIKKEIVTLRKEVDISRGEGTHVSPDMWNEIISDPGTFVLDTRNDYEYEVGHFQGAVDPATGSFSELPEYVEKTLDPKVHKRIAMYCTGGIRCEKFAPYMKQLGFEEVYQLKGGILGYLEEVPEGKSLWEGECFVFDERVSVDDELAKGEAEDPSFFKNRRS